ncbi:hypothetical protein PoB_006861300 [Plakobranchus ocellatus]|uniref:DUF19 domain-containing protein n=1 Tax=Plakobranchus ocellatus TaxID=259542 RepID=A0AAV4DD09_9GAST|nr:hypothetical protein PoB_006861300 [Plakobranchus ocellatus]
MKDLHLHLFYRLVRTGPAQATDMWKLLPFLPCLLLVTEVKGDCQGLKACGNILSINESAFFPNVFATKALDRICREQSSYNSCVMNRLDACDNTVEKLICLAKYMWRGYMCSSEGRQVFLTLASSNCADNPHLGVQIQYMTGQCFNIFKRDLKLTALAFALSGGKLKLSDACPYIDLLKTCWKQTATDMCGAEMGTFVSDINKMKYNYALAGFRCPQST